MPSQPNRLLIPSFPSSTPRPLPLGGRATPKALRPREWAGLSNDEILSRFVPGKASPHTVLEVLLKLHNMEHTARAKSVSFKTRYERANFLRHFFRELESRGGFKKAPDPRNLGQRHIQAAVDLWRKDGLKPSTIQTYLSFLRGLASWLSKPGFIRPPAYYGLELAEYQRSGINERDKSWSAQGVDVDGLIDKVAAFDPYVGGMLRLIRAFGLRKREAIMFRPNECVVNFADTGLPLAEKQGEEYVWIRQGAKGGRPRFV
ncbi:MAG TPA: integrase domain-containing protein, partial [Ottowia sp.]|nr:integrase domain-containing protein [Ottowia sp.]